MLRVSSVQLARPVCAAIRPPRSRRIRAVALLGLVVLLSQVAAQDEPSRIGYIDMERLFDNAPQVIAAREALDQEFRPRNEALLADEMRLERLRQDLANIDPDNREQRFDREREIRNLSQSIDRRREDLAQELRFRTNAEKKALEDTIGIAIEQVAEQQAFDLILTSPVAFASQRVDITDQILNWLREDFANQPDGELTRQ